MNTPIAAKFFGYLLVGCLVASYIVVIGGAAGLLEAGTVGLLALLGALCTSLAAAAYLLTANDGIRSMLSGR